MRSVGFVAGAVSCAFALIGAGSTADAKIATITYTGFVYQSSDGLGLYGPKGSSFDGDSVSLVFSLDTSKGLGFGACTPTGYCFNEQTGGTSTGYSSPLTAILTIDGLAETLDGALSATDGVTTGPGRFCANPLSCSFSQQVIQNSPVDQATVTVQTTGATQFPLSLTTPYNIVIDYQQIFAGGSFSLSDGTSDGLITGAQFAFERVSLTTTSALPEQGVWSAMTLGFAGLGSMLRWRKNANLRCEVSATMP